MRNDVAIMLLISFCFIGVGSVAFAGPSDEVCKHVYEYYHAPCDLVVKGPNLDTAIIGIKCMTAAQKAADDELILYDLSQLLNKAKISPSRYREMMADAINIKCINNSFSQGAMPYDKFKKSVCIQKKSKK